MTRIILITACILIWGSLAFSQTTVSLNINHKLGTADFAMNEGAKNNMEHDFNVTRLEYYISEISLIHDGGLETLVEDLWILVNASSLTEIELGNYDITTLEAINFHIGVNEEENHSDPATYSHDHPLSPMAPSMHWGWTAGYRFIAYEGKGGSSFNQTYQLHGLGDVNYHKTEIDFIIQADDGLLNINLDADYARAMEDISLNSGVINHGETGAAKKCIENFRDYVFSPTGTISSNINFDDEFRIDLFPNPAENSTTINFDVADDILSYDLTLLTIEGKQIQFLQSVKNGQSLDLKNYPAGMYFVKLSNEGRLVQSSKLYIK